MNDGQTWKTRALLIGALVGALTGLGVYLREKGIGKVHLSYFGTADPAYYGIQYDWMPSYFLPEDYRARSTKIRSYSHPTSGIVAISATNLQSVYFPVTSTFMTG